jgi:hypothetical protein
MLIRKACALASQELVCTVEKNTAGQKRWLTTGDRGRRHRSPDVGKGHAAVHRDSVFPVKNDLMIAWGRSAAVASAAAFLFLSGCSATVRVLSDGSAGADGSVTDGAPKDGPPAADAQKDIDWPDAPPTEPPGTFVAVGYGARRIRSTDGKTWTDDVSLEYDASVGTDAAGNDTALLWTVIWAEQQFMAFGWRVMTSSDGEVWQDYGVNALDQWLGAVVFAKGLFVGVGGYGVRVSSTDGLTWQRHDLDTVAVYAPDGLVYDPSGTGTFVSANFSGQRSVSTDGMTWTYSTGALATMTTDLAVGNGIVVGTSATSVVVSSDGGLTWTDAAQLAQPAKALIFADGHFTVISAGHAFTSVDGQAWIDHPIKGLDGTAVAHGHGTYVMLSPAGIRRSPDGLEWEGPLASPSTNGLVWVTFGSAGDVISDAGSQ